MKKVLPVVALFSFLFAVVVAQFISVSRSIPTPVVTAPTSIEQAIKTSEVMDVDLDVVGSCFPVAIEFGCMALVSCKHVVVDPTPVAVRLPNGDILPIIEIDMNPVVDIAVIWIRANPSLRIAPMPVSETAPPPIGTEAMLAGYPLEQGLWVSKGLVGSPSPRWGGSWTSIPIYYGCSGGPVLVDGIVIGVASGILIDPKRKASVSTVSYVIMADAFREWLKESLTDDPMIK